MDLHVITVIIRNSQTQIALTYRDGTRAEAARIALISAKDQAADVRDDFGNLVHIAFADCAAVIMQNLGEAHEGQAEIQLAGARAQKRLQRKAQADPSLNGTFESRPIVVGPRAN